MSGAFRDPAANDRNEWPTTNDPQQKTSEPSERRTTHASQYLTIAFRNLRWNAGYTAINLTGLAVGMVACLLIGLYVRYELSYDAFHAKGDRIYRVDEVTDVISK